MADSRGRMLKALLGMVVAGMLTVAHAQTPGPVTYSYDELGRLIAVIDASGNAAVYSYDPVGNILSIQRYTSSQVSVIAFSPDHGPAGSSVTITGTGFSADPPSNAVSFNGVSAVITALTTTQIVATVPPTASTGPITVTSPFGTAVSTKSFKIAPASLTPTITGFSPAVIDVGSSLTVSGTNFDPSPANNRLRFNNVATSAVSSGQRPLHIMANRGR